MKKYPVILLLTRRGGDIVYDDVADALALDPDLASFFEPGEALAVMVANASAPPVGWASAFVIVHADAQPTPAVFVVGLGLHEPVDLETFITCFPEMEYNGVTDPDIQRMDYGVRSISVLTADEFQQVLDRYPAPAPQCGEPTPYLAENRTLH